MSESRSEGEAPEVAASYTLEAVVRLTGVSRREIVVYCRSGLVSPEGDLKTEDLKFNDAAVYHIRKIEQLRVEQGISLAGIRMIYELMAEVQHLREEMRFLRY